jgi:hypothetical protein
MHKNYSVIDIELDEEIPIITEVKEIHDLRRVPIGIDIVDGRPNRGQIYKWWIERAVPACPEFLQAVRIPSVGFLLTKGLSLSLSDQYWINPKGSDLKWVQVNYFENIFSEDIGKFLFNYEQKEDDEYNFFSPDVTSTGNLRKKWVIKCDERVLRQQNDPRYRLSREVENRTLGGNLEKC